MMKINNTNGAEYAPLGIYVHIPFCIRKCKYCDFVSYADKTCEEKEDYVQKICEEIRRQGSMLKKKYYVDTIFFGGGTPTTLEANQLIRILDCIGDSFVVGCINARTCGAGLHNCDGLEISFEANPGTITKEKLQNLKDAGFNRISIGVQSFDDGILNTLGRIHDSKNASETVSMALELGFNTNLDLMFGVPGQNLDIWRTTLEKAIKLNPSHISFYSLQLEEGTSLYESYRYGDLELPSWEENRAMYHLALDMLQCAGYVHYEISNAAKPGFECKHNMKYWSMQDYLGIGKAAHSYIDGKRTGEDAPDSKGDFIFTKLRLIDGFEKKEYENRFGITFDEEFKLSYPKLIEEGLLEEINGRIRFTRKGLDYTNPVMQSLLEEI